MAELLKFKHGLLANMKDNSPAISAGTVYITRDERAMYVDLPPYKKANGEVEDAKRIRIGDMRTYEYLSELTDDLAADRSNLIKSALYYVEKKKVTNAEGKEEDLTINALFKWNGSQFIQLNSVSDISANISDLEARVLAVETQVATHDSRIGTNEKDIEALEKSVENLGTTKADKTEVDSEVERLEGLINNKASTVDLNTLSQTVSSNQSAVDAALDTLNKDLEDEIARAEGVEAEHLKKIEDNTSNITKNTNAITVLNGSDTATGSVAKQVKDAVDAEASTRAAAIAGIESSINNINSDIGNIQTKNADQDAAINERVTITQGVNNVVMVTGSDGKVTTGAAVADKLTHLSGVTKNIQTQFTEVDTRIGKVESDVAGYIARFETNEEDIGNNAEAIEELQKELTDLKGSGSGSITEQIAAAVNAEAKTREEADKQHTDDIAENTEAIGELTNTLSQLSSKHDTFETTVANTYETQIHAANTYETKTNAANTYATKEELNTTKSDLIGTNKDAVTANTIWAAKNAANEAASDASGAQATADSAVTKADNAQTTINNYITSNDAALAGVKATADAAATKEEFNEAIAGCREAEEALNEAIAGEAARAEGVEADFEKRISTMETFWATTEDSDNVVNTLKEIQEYIATDESGATAMAGSIQQNTADISGLTTRMIAAEGNISTLQDDLAKETAARESAVSGAVTTSKNYTDDALTWGTF